MDSGHLLQETSLCDLRIKARPLFVAMDFYYESRETARGKQSKQLLGKG